MKTFKEFIKEAKKVILPKEVKVKDIPKIDDGAFYVFQGEKYIKKHIEDNSKYKYPEYNKMWVSRGAWAMYIAKSEKPDEIAILADYDKSEYTVK